MHYSPRPKFIREAANAFVADTIGTWDIVRGGSAEALPR